MPFGRLFSTFGNHIQFRPGPIGLRYRSHSESRSELLRYSYLHLYGMDQARLIISSSLWCTWRDTWRPSYARCADRLRSLGALTGSPPGVRVYLSVGVLAITCLSALIIVFHRRFLSTPLVSSLGALPVQ